MTQAFDRFKYEEMLLESWSTVGDLNILADAIRSGSVCPDHAADALNGISVMLNLRFNTLFKEFEKSGLKLQ